MTTTGPRRLAIIGGDGIGPEVVAEGRKVLAALESAGHVHTEQVVFDAGGERYLRTGEALPDEMLEELRTFDAIYFGAIGRRDIPPGLWAPSFSSRSGGASGSSPTFDRSSSTLGSVSDP